MKRRQIIISSLTLTALMASPLSSAAPNEPALSPIERLSKLYPETHMYKKIAATGLSLTSVTLENALESILRRIDFTKHKTDNALQLAIATASQEDFSSSRTKNISGWVLSEFEINLCVALSHAEKQ